MNINTGQFTDTYLPILNKHSIIISHSTYWLNKKYGQSFVVAPTYPEYVDQKSFDVIRYKSVGKMIRQIQKQYMDIIHTHSPFQTGEIALKIARERNIPIVSTIHSNYIVENQHFKFKLFTNHYIKKIVKFYNQVDYLFSDNHAVVDALRPYGFEGNIEIMENGTDFIYNEEEIEKNKSYINHLYGIEPDTNVLLYVGGLAWYKNIKLIMDSLVNLKELRQRFKMIFIGEGPARVDMMKFVEENKLKRNVIFVGELNDRDQLKKYYTRSNLLLYPSTYNTSGIAVREAASLRCPSLVLKEVSEIIKDNYNGYLSDNNGLSYAQRIISALNDRNKEDVTIKAQLTLSKHYEKIVDDLAIRYNEIIKINKQY